MSFPKTRQRSRGALTILAAHAACHSTSLRLLVKSQGLSAIIRLMQLTCRCNHGWMRKRTCSAILCLFYLVLQNSGGVVINISATLDYRGQVFQAHAGSAKAAIGNLNVSAHALQWAFATDCSGPPRAFQLDFI